MFCCCCVQRSSSFWYWHWLTLLDRGAHNCLKMGECSEVHRWDGRSKGLFETRSWTICFFLSFFNSIISFSLYEYLKIGEWWEVHWGYGRSKGLFETSSTSILIFAYFLQFLFLCIYMGIWRWVSVEKCIGEIVQRSVWNQFHNSVPHRCLQINSTITQPFSMSPICPSSSLKNHQIREAPKKWYFLGIFLKKGGGGVRDS